jgi:hypothetical protein
MAYKVFISSTYKDIDLAKDLARRLEEAGVEVYSVDKAVVGERLNVAISRGLSNADEVVVLLTDNSVSSSGLMFEIGAASSLRKRITPVLVGLEKNELPSIIKDMKYIKYPDLPKYLSDLERRTKAA